MSSLFVCPFDRTHRFTRVLDIFPHVAECAKWYPEDYRVCRHNLGHFVLVKDYDSHDQMCIDRDKSNSGSSGSSGNSGGSSGNSGGGGIPAGHEGFYMAAIARPHEPLPEIGEYGNCQTCGHPFMRPGLVKKHFRKNPTHAADTYFVKDFSIPSMEKSETNEDW